jgi:phosphopantetheine--protein transferase-like protein
MQAIGNDIIDLHHLSIMEHRDEDWMHRHLTSDEWRFLSDYSNQERMLTFWKIFALKEASSKAITQLGCYVPVGSFTHFETDLDRNLVEHCSGEILYVQNLEVNQDWIHAVVTSAADSKIIWEVHRVDSNASEFLQDKLFKSLRRNGILQAAFAQKNGIPFAIQNGRLICPVSFSHSGRFAAFSWQLQAS